MNRTGRYIRMFAEEAILRLDRMSREIHRLAEDPTSIELISSIARDAHTLRGSSGLVGMDRLGEVALHFEDLLAELRDGARGVDTSVIAALLAATATLRQLVEASASGASVDDRARDVDVALTALLTREPRRPPSPDPSGFVIACQTAPFARPCTASDGRVGQEAIEVGHSAISGPRLDALVRLMDEADIAQSRLEAAIDIRVGGNVDAIDEFRVLAAVIDELRQLVLCSRLSADTPTLHLERP